MPQGNLYRTPLYLLLLIGCTTDKLTDASDPVTEGDLDSLYFPPITGTAWATVDPETLGWDNDAEESLYDYLEETGTDGFMILKSGRIVTEWYFGNFTQTSTHSWNSAAKTLTAMTIGIAQEAGKLDIQAATSDYLGTGWSSLTPEQEGQIKVVHHLTMTTGLDYEVEAPNCHDPDCFYYKNEPGAFWYYHNGAYTLLDDIATAATGTPFSDYFKEKIGEPIGMDGNWYTLGYLNLYISNLRSMARFGLLALNEGDWENTVILGDKSYFSVMTSSSQDLNPAYGYLWWLNGKSAFRVPQSEAQFQGELIPSAPSDLFAGLGAYDQKLYVVPSQGLVIVRMGDDAGESELGPTDYDNTLWQKVTAFIGP